MLGSAGHGRIILVGRMDQWTEREGSKIMHDRYSNATYMPMSILDDMYM